MLKLLLLPSPQMDESGACVASTSHILEGVDIALIHDLAVTENYYILALGSIKVGRKACGPGASWKGLVTCCGVTHSCNNNPS